MKQFFLMVMISALGGAMLLLMHERQAVGE
jgi:hypothetical protein